ncbi:hypothetical protein [Mucilaginibacter flavidus]|uniref:hypothetical protein n=1 Tax=Mucilaginibacter flavidus TaxID=2949309 RepID=UPI0020935922|nr:hypothetical protein [Mucilaginibacter flavidus]MCO5948312.1 hypothetical protein [Mucilaginibacter flavidus]
MPKHAVFPYMLFTKFVDEPTLKKLCLFFDHIYVNENSLGQIVNFTPKQTSEYAESNNYEKATWQYLLDKNVVKTYPFFSGKFDAPTEGEESFLVELFKSLMPQSNAAKANIDEMTEKEKEQLRQQFYLHHFLSHDVMIRLDTLQLRNQFDDEFYPIVRTNGSFEPKGQAKKSSVIQFLLNDIPEPDFNTSWEQIIEFKSDEDTKIKYLALINWTNKVSQSETSLSDLKDEYEYLYHDYIKHFKLHKLKYNNTVLELIVNAGVAVFSAFQTGAYIPVVKNLLQMNLSQANLAADEAKIPGKEVAYIYHAKQQFSNKD